MRIGIPRETKPGECRVAVTPSGVRALRGSGAGIAVETGAGAASGFDDGEYRDAGGTIVPPAAGGGPGTPPAGAPGSPPGNVTVLGAGVAGRNAARIAAAIGANVTLLDVNPEKLATANRECGGKARVIRSTPEAGGD